MPRTLHILTVDGAGKTTLLAGPETPIQDVIKLWESMKPLGALKKGVESALLFDSDKGLLATLFNELKRRFDSSKATVGEVVAELKAAEERVKTCKERLRESTEKQNAVPKIDVPKGLDPKAAESFKENSANAYKAGWNRAIAERKDQLGRAEAEVERLKKRKEEAEAEHAQYAKA